MLAPIDTASPLGPLSRYFTQCANLTNDDLALLGEVVLRNLEVERGGSLSYAARDVVVGSVTGAEPAAKVAGLTDGHTTEMGADTCCCQYAERAVFRCSVRTQHDQPLGLLDTVAVGLGVTQRLPLGVLGLLDFALGAVTDEDGLASPLDNDLCCLSCCPEPSSLCRKTHVLALGNGGEINLNLGLGQNVGRGGHVDEEVCRAVR